MLAFLFVSLVFSLSSPFSHAAPPDCTATLASLRASQTSFLQRLAPPRPQPFPPTQRQIWLSFLLSVQTSSPCLTSSSNLQLRHLLENEGDRDRNRFRGFPETLTLQIISLILRLDRLRLRSSRPPPPRSSSTPASSPSPSPSATSHHPASRTPHPRTLRSPETTEIYTDSSLEAAAAASKDKDSPAQPLDTESDAPPIEYTERDLERFLPPQTLLIWPITQGRLTSGFGLRRDPFSRKTRFHNGIDIGAPFGTPVRSAAPGKVIATGWMGSCGLAVILAHDKGLSTAYCHLSQILALRGSLLPRGSLLGRIGSTGRSTRPHLHFSVYLHQRTINPLRFLPPSSFPH